MAQEPKYEERYCAYVDILAFKALVAELRAVPSRLETIRTLLKKFAIRTMNVISVSEIQTFAYKASQTPLLFPYDQPLKDFRFYALHCENLSLAMLHEGYFTRGAVCRGLLYHDESMVFGEALIKAYRLELGGSQISPDHAHKGYCR